MNIKGYLSTGIVVVDGKILSPKYSQAIWNHSPDGFSWGYQGSGPAQLALAILLEAGLHPKKAVSLHQRFKADIVAHWPLGENFDADVDVDAWVATCMGSGGRD